MQFYDTLPINKWQHLDLTERFYFEKMIARGYSNRAKARGLNRPHSTINNVIKHGIIKQKKIINGKEEYYTKYDAYAAQGFYELNRERSVKFFKSVGASKFIEFAVDKIRIHKWSPDAVAGFAYVQGLFTKKEIVSAKTLYNYIDLKLIDLDNFDLLLKLSRKATKQAPK